MRRKPVLRDDSGSSLVETALVFPMFLAMLFGILQVGIYGWTVASFDNALVTASRKIRTGESDGPTDAASFMNLICSNMINPDCLSRLDVVVQSGGSAGQVTSAAQSPTATPVFQPGSANSYVLVTATYAWPLTIPFVSLNYPQQNGQVLITNRLLFKNEPYS